MSRGPSRETIKEPTGPPDLAGLSCKEIPLSDSTLLSTLRRWAKNISLGGAWSYGGGAGLWYLYLGPTRSGSSGYIGFRPKDLADLVRDAEEAPELREEVARLRVALDKMRIDRDHVHEYNVRLVGRAQDAEAHRDVLAARVTNLEAEIERVMAVVHAWEARADYDWHSGGGGALFVDIAADIRAAIRGEEGIK